MILKIHEQLVVYHSEEHEKLVVLKEMEFVLRISDAWLSENYFLFSSYRLTYLRVYFKPIYLLVVLFMVLIHGILNSYYFSKALILFITMLTFTVYVSILPIYRCSSSSVLQVFSFWVITSNMFLGYLKASNYPSQYLEDANFVDILWTMDLLSICSIGGIILVILISRLEWPVTSNEIKILEACYKMLIKDLRVAEEMILKLKTMGSYLLVQPRAIEKMINLLLGHYKILNHEDHSLQYTVLNQIDTLEFMWQRVVQDSLLPCRKLEKNLSDFVRVVLRRWHSEMLMNPVKRRILLKILCLNLFFGNRKTLPFTTGIDESFYGDFEYKRGEKASSDTTFTGVNDTIVPVDEKYLIESSRQLKEIRHAVERRNIKKMIELTENYVECADLDLIDELRDSWDILGRELLPLSLYEQLYADDIQLDLS